MVHTACLYNLRKNFKFKTCFICGTSQKKNCEPAHEILGLPGRAVHFQCLKTARNDRLEDIDMFVAGEGEEVDFGDTETRDDQIDAGSAIQKLIEQAIIIDKQELYRQQSELLKKVGKEPQTIGNFSRSIKRLLNKGAFCYEDTPSRAKPPCPARTFYYVPEFEKHNVQAQLDMLPGGRRMYALPDFIKL